jgi:hypothetical protein
MMLSESRKRCRIHQYRISIMRHTNSSSIPPVMATHGIGFFPGAWCMTIPSRFPSTCHQLWFPHLHAFPSTLEHVLSLLTTYRNNHNHKVLLQVSLIWRSILDIGYSKQKVLLGKKNGKSDDQIFALEDFVPILDLKRLTLRAASSRFGSPNPLSAHTYTCTEVTT